MIRSILTSLFCLLFVGMAWAQKPTYTLQEARDYAIQNSYAAQLAVLENEKAKRQIQQTAAIGLPQANGKVEYQQFLEAPVVLLPDGFTGPPDGNPDEAVFQQEFNLTASGTVSQIIFDGSYFVGLQASKAYADFVRQQGQLSEREVIDQVTQAYHMALIAKENVELVSQSKTLLETTLNETQALYDNGFAEKQDLDQLKLSLQDLDNRIAYASNQQELAMQLLKFQMGLPQSENFALTDTFESLSAQTDGLELMTQTFDIQQNIDYQLLNSGVGLSELQLKLEKAKALPSIAAFYSYQQNAQRSQFNFADTDEPWFPTQLLGVTLNVPIFSGLGRLRSQQIARVEVEKATIQRDQAAQGAELEYNTAKTEYAFSLQNKVSKEESMELAEDIFNTSQIKYKEGVGSSFELTQSKNQMLAAQGEYINAVLQLLNAKNRLNKALGNY